MDIRYDEKEDILFIRFSDEKVVRDVSHGWNVNVGMTAKGIGQITILDAKASDLLPIRIAPELATH
jgi:uncharacterized protein YuzE